MPADYRVSITNAPGADSYPISSFTWLLIPTHSTDPAKTKALAGLPELDAGSRRKRGGCANVRSIAQAGSGYGSQEHRDRKIASRRTDLSPGPCGIFFYLTSIRRSKPDTIDPRINRQENRIVSSTCMTTERDTSPPLIYASPPAQSRLRFSPEPAPAVAGATLLQFGTSSQARKRPRCRQQLRRGHAGLRLQHLRDRSLHLCHSGHSLPSESRPVRLEVFHSPGVGSGLRRLRRSALHLSALSPRPYSPCAWRSRWRLA